MAKTVKADTDKADEAAEAKADQNLTPLGRRTLSGYVQKWGEESGEKRFLNALDLGTIDKSKMLKDPKKKADLGTTY